MKNRIITILLLFSYATVVCAAASKDVPKYPSKPIQLYVGAVAGGGTDVLARLTAKELETKLGQSVLIVNKAGGSGTLANLEVTQSSSDGYTLGVLTDFETIGNLLSGQNLGYTKDDLKIIGSINASTNILILGKNFKGQKNLEGFVDHCKANPGKTTISTSSAAQRMVLQSLADSADIKFTTVPFNSGANSFNSLVGGQVDACFIAPTFYQQAVDNGCTVIAVGSDERFSLLPNVPTFKESGYKTINNEVTRIFFAPKNTPDAIIKILEDELQTVTNTPEFKASLEKTKEMYSYKSAEQAKKSFDDKYASIKKVVETNPSILK